MKSIVKKKQLSREQLKTELKTAKNKISALKRIITMQKEKIEFLEGVRSRTGIGFSYGRDSGDK